MQRRPVKLVDYTLLVCFLAGMLSCSTSKYAAGKKYHPQQLQEDLNVLWKTYQQAHPSYNWYTPTDSVDARFKKVQASLTDSLTEAEFRLRLAWAVAAFRCGHTAVLPPKAAAKAASKKPTTAFPLQVRVLENDSMVVIQNTGPDKDSVKRGVVVKSIDDVPAATFIRQMEEYISVDGYHNGFAESLIGSGFPARFKWMYGLKPSYKIQYLDSAFRQQQATIRNFEPKPKDSVRKSISPTGATKTKPAAARPAYGFLEIDSANSIAYMRLNSFSGNKVSPFIRSSFKQVAKSKSNNLIVDLRNNSGGRIQKSILLGRYLAEEPFKVADSVSAVSLKFPYPRYVQAHLFYKLFGWIIASRQADGRLHMKSTERTMHKPKKKHHFDGNLYVITGGRSFSASVLLINYISNRKQFTLVGEETGGGARGNSAVMTPNITLPNSKIRARLPLFRIVTHAGLPHNGRGILPDIPVSPNSADIRRNADPALEALKKMIEAN